MIEAPSQRIYEAFMDPALLVSWLPPAGMKGEILRFEPKAGGRCRMVLTYEETQHTPGKSSEHSDIFDACFVELVPNERIVQTIHFQSDDPIFARPMKLTWSFTKVSGGTEVSIVCEDVPAVISKEDHAAGLSSSLANLAAIVE